MRRFYYLSSLVFIFALPASVEAYFVINRISIPILAAFVFGITILGGTWDIWATRHGKNDSVWLWQFNKRDTIGIEFLGLPIEEYAFYLVSSLYIVLTWEGIQTSLQSHDQFMTALIPCLALWSLIAALIPYWRRPKHDRLQ